MRSQSSSSPALLPEAERLPADRGGMLLLSPALSPLPSMGGVGGTPLFFCPRRNMEASEGRRGDGLPVSEDGEYGDAGRGFGRGILTDSGPELVLARLRPCVGGTCPCGYRWSIDEASVLSDVDEGTPTALGVGMGMGSGSGGASEWLRLSERSMSRSPVIPSLVLLRFFPPDADIPLPPVPLSSEGNVTVLLIASPQRHSRFVPELTPSIAGVCGWSWNASSGMPPMSSAAKEETESVWFSISLSRTSWRWLRSCLPVDARHARLGGLASGGLTVRISAAGAGLVALAPGVGVGGLDSSPASVIARSRLTFLTSCWLPPTALATIAGAETLVDGAELLSFAPADPPPSSMRSSAHSQEMRYRELMV